MLATAVNGCRFCAEVIQWLQVYEDENEYYSRENRKLMDEVYEREDKIFTLGHELDPSASAHWYDEFPPDEDPQVFTDTNEINFGLHARCNDSTDLPDITGIDILIFHGHQWIVLAFLLVTAKFGEHIQR
jgi:hypothetical protein